jgi:ATP-dependent DNA ligase
MSKVEAVILATKPHRPVDYNEAQLQTVLNERYLIADKKEDGVRLNLVVKPSIFTDKYHTEWLSREGKRFPRLSASPLARDGRWATFFNQSFGDSALFPEGFMLDAELIVLDHLGKPMACKDTAGSLRRDPSKAGQMHVSRLKVVVFGIVPIDAVLSGEAYEIPHCVMKYHVEYQVTLLQKRFPEIQWEVVESVDVFSLGELHAFYEKVRADGGEGVVAKDPNGFYKRSKQIGMWKVVPDEFEDGKVVGLIWGTEGKANEGKVIGFEVLLESGHVVNACKISKAQMDEFTAKVLPDIERVTADECAWWRENPMDAYYNPYKGWTCRVTFMERYENGSLRHPSFDSFRGISDPLIKE